MLFSGKDPAKGVFNIRRGVPEVDLHYETEARKVMVEIKFDALYR